MTEPSLSDDVLAAALADQDAPQVKVEGTPPAEGAPMDAMQAAYMMATTAAMRLNEIHSGKNAPKPRVTDRLAIAQVYAQLATAEALEKVAALLQPQPYPSPVFIEPAKRRWFRRN